MEFPTLVSVEESLPTSMELLRDLATTAHRLLWIANMLMEFPSPTVTLGNTFGPLLQEYFQVVMLALVVIHH